MAIVVRNKSVCPICDKTIGGADKIISFPPIVTNEKSHLFDFNDRAFHHECFEKHNLATEAIELFDLWERKTATRECFICGRQITEPNDYYSFPFFSKDLENTLSEFNFSQAHRSCIAGWDKLRQVVQGIEGLQKSGLWGGDASIKVLEELKGFISIQGQTLISEK